MTGSVERGRDGVGDYTRLLATECAERGIPVVIVALADRYVQQPTREDWPVGIRVLRLPHHARWSERIAATRALLREFAPSWVSLQFVQYSYQRWGIPVMLARKIGRLVGKARLHIMFHEIWIGPHGSWRRRLVSAAQRRLVLSLATRAEVVHTSNEYYCNVLTSHGIETHILPLFSSVPVTPVPEHGWFLETLAASGCDSIEQRRVDWWVLMLFGTIHPEWPAAPLLPRLAKVAIDAGKKLVIVSVGRLGAGTGPWQTMTRRHGEEAAFVMLGEQPEERVAEALRQADFGIATSPYVLLGKSSTAAAMFDHGLPVIVNRDDGVPTTEDGLDERRRALIIRLDDHFADRLRSVRRLPVQCGVSDCASQWLRALQSATVPVTS